MTRYVVANRDWTGVVTSVIPVVEFFDIKGKRVADAEDAVCCAVPDGNVLDLELVPIFSVH